MKKKHPKRGLKKGYAFLAMTLISCSAGSAQAVTGFIHRLLPPMDTAGYGLPNLPYPEVLGDLPMLHLPDGFIPNGSFELPSPPLLPLSNSLLPRNPESNTIAACGAGADLREGAVFSALNLQPNNQLIAFARDSNGMLCQAGVFDTGGAADPCGIPCSGQNGVISDEGYVFVVNPTNEENILYGNGTISVFRIERDHLVLTDVEDAGGPNTHSVTKHNDLLYVVNGGFYAGLLGPALSFIPQSVRGFRFDSTTGDLTFIPGTDTRTIDAAGDAGQIGFTGDGRNIVVSNRRTSLALTSGAEPDNIEVMTLGANGIPIRVQQHDVGGDTPFGFRMLGNRVYLSMGGAAQNPNNGSSGVFEIEPNGNMNVLTESTQDQGDDTCWNAITTTTTDGPYFFTSAYFDSALGRWKINDDGTMSLLDPVYDVTNIIGNDAWMFGQGGLDMSITAKPNPTEFIYVLNNPIEPALGLPFVRMVGYEVLPDGNLNRLGQDVVKGLPNSGWGLWAL